MTAELNVVPAMLRASGLRIAAVGTQYAESQRRAAVAALEGKNHNPSDKLCRAFNQSYPDTEEIFENRSDLGENTRKYGDQISDSASLYESADEESGARVMRVEPEVGGGGSGHGGTVGNAGHGGSGHYGDGGPPGGESYVGAGRPAWGEADSMTPHPAPVAPAPNDPVPSVTATPSNTVAGLSGDEARPNDLYAGLDDDIDEPPLAEAEFDDQDGESDAQAGESEVQDGESEVQDGESDARDEGSDDQDGESDAQAGESEVQDGESDAQDEADTQWQEGSPERPALVSVLEALDGSLLHAVFSTDVLSEHLTSIGTAKAE